MYDVNQTIISELYNSMNNVPQPVLDIYKQEAWPDQVASIAYDYNLTDEEAEEVMLIIGGILGQMVDPDDFPLMLDQKITMVGDKTLDDLVTTLTDDILRPIHDALIIQLDESIDAQLRILPDKNNTLEFTANGTSNKISDEQEVPATPTKQQDTDFFDAVATHQSQQTEEKEQQTSQATSTKKPQPALMKRQQELIQKINRLRSISYPGITNAGVLEEELNGIKSPDTTELKTKIQEIKQQRIEQADNPQVDTAELQRKQKELEARLAKKTHRSKGEQASIEKQLSVIEQKKANEQKIEQLQGELDDIRAKLQQ